MPHQVILLVVFLWYNLYMKILKNIIYSLFSSFALSVSINHIINNAIIRVPFLKKLDISNSNIYIFIIIMVILLGLLLWFYLTRKKTKDLYAGVLASFFAICLIISNAFFYYGTLWKVFSFPYFFLVIIGFIGYFIFFKYLIIAIRKYFKKYMASDKLKENKLIKKFNKHPFLYSFILICLSWVIYYIAYYPIVLSPDPAYQLEMALGMRTKYMDFNIPLSESVVITNHHPILHTLFLGGCLKLGRLLINDNFGLFIYSFIQGICLALTLARTISFLQKRMVKNKYLLLMLGAYMFVPMFGLYAINANKDVYYTIFFIHLIMNIYEFIEGYKVKKYPYSKAIILFFNMLLLSLFRNNGIYLVFFLALLMPFYSKVNIRKVSLVFLSCFCLYLGFDKVLLPYFKVTPTSDREKLSVVIQQLGRLVKYKGDELSHEEKESINKVLDYNNMARLYDPEKADPIKSTFNRYARKKDMQAFYKVWYVNLFKYPYIYIDATLNNIYGYFAIDENSWYTYTSFDNIVVRDEAVDYSYNNLDSLRKITGDYAKSFPYIPIIGLISNIGFSVWLIISFTWYMIYYKKYKYIILMTPFLVSILVCMLSPVNTYFRYAMPYVFSILLLIGLFSLIIKKEPSK